METENWGGGGLEVEVYNDKYKDGYLDRREGYGEERRISYLED